jgi:2-oxoglutarate/2-oxoacid ferredoxin oxidoreductase subunit alpha
MSNTKVKNIIRRDDVVIKFAGDSGDGMQLTGTLFSEAAAIAGKDLATFPDYPAEIRAPHNTIAGVSGFQVHIGHKKIHTSGDLCDVIVAMNPASLRANIKWAKKGATIIVDKDAFEEKAIEKAGYKSNPLEDGSLEIFHLVDAPISTLTKESIKELGLGSKVADKSRNMFALGMMLFIFDIGFDSTYSFLQKKFKASPDIIEANERVLRAGFNYAETIEIVESKIDVPAAELPKGRYRNITGNVATSWGFLAASERSGRPLFLGSYPITPATEILMDLAKHKYLGARVFQAEDEIAGICSAIGAAYAGSLAITTTSGPGLSLKSEAMGLAVMTELPLVIVNVQRGGPSTGLPTKSEQSDLLQALYGRNGECPMIVLAASSSSNCFDYAFMAAKLAMEHMTPVLLLTDGNLGNGSQLFKIPKVADLPEINPPVAEANTTYKPYERNPVTLARKWALPGTEGLRHRIGGLEKENIHGNVTTDPLNHELMIKLRQEKVDKVADYIPEQTITGDASGDLLVVSWGSTAGSMLTAVQEMREEGASISHTHFHYIMPLPKNTADVFKGFKKIVVCEQNMGQFAGYLRMQHPQFTYQQFNKVQCLPFMVHELKEKFTQILEEK